MVESAKSILERAPRLPEADRTMLVRQLIDSLGPAVDEARHETDPAVERAWAQEVRRRVEKMDRGEMTFIPGDEVRRQIRKMIDDRRMEG